MVDFATFRRTISGLSDDEVRGVRLKLINSAEFAAADYRQEWLVEGAVVKGQPLLVGGPRKACKTTITLDLGLSIGSGKPFLGRFQVPEAVPVAIFSGESGEATLQETAKRIAQSRGIDLPRSKVHWGFVPPRIASASDLDELRDLIQEHGIKVVVIDPLYLSLCGGEREIDTGNLFSTGPILQGVAKTCLDLGATPILVHHTKKLGERNEHKPLDLDDLAYSGFQEFARQWLLVNRRSPFIEGSGRHELWLKVGGSAGHNGLYGVDAEEGFLDRRFGGRKWDVTVRTADAVRDEQAAAKEERKKDKDADAIEKAIAVVKAGPITQTGLQRATGWGHEKTKRILNLLVSQGTAQEHGGKYQHQHAADRSGA